MRAVRVYCNAMDFLLVVLVLLVSVAAHEAAHAWQAWREGDPTAGDLGRITLNPLKHLDVVGSLLAPLVLYLLPGDLVLGWAKPVPVNPANFRSPRAGDVRVSVAGIVANLGLAALASVAWIVVWPVVGATSLGDGLGSGLAAAAGAGVSSLLLYAVLINLTLAWFNLMPLPPLDGSRVLRHLLPRRLQAPYLRFGWYGTLGVLLAAALAPGGFATLFAPVRFVFDRVLQAGLG